MSPDHLSRPFTFTDAESAGHHLDVSDGNAKRIDASHQWIADCVNDAGERCWSFAIYSDIEAGKRDFIEHAAREAGVCWACSQPESDRPNRESCRRCWLMHHSEVHHLFPRDCPPFPGDDL
jgi:hypothetical protein